MVVGAGVLTLSLEELFRGITVPPSKTAPKDDYRVGLEEAWTAIFAGESETKDFFLPSSNEAMNIVINIRELLTRYVKSRSAHRELFWMAVKRAMRNHNTEEIRLQVRWAMQKQRSIKIVRIFPGRDAFLMDLEPCN